PARTPGAGAGQSPPPVASQNFGAGRAATSAPPALKLVPPSPKKGASAPPDEAPFPLGEPSPRDAPPFAFDDGLPPFFDAPEPPSFFDEVRPGVDAAGPPVVLGSPHAGSAAPHAAGADDTTALIKRGLEGRGKPFLAAAVEGARRVVVEGDEVQIEFAPEGKHLRDALSKPENMRLLREVCCEALGRQVGVGFAVRVPGESDDLPLSRQDEEKLEQKRLREIAESHPLVQQVLKTFRGEIIEVRRVEE
ncbi:MAG TPA: hypothetical protein VN228_02760, partial [Pyrinomonadaceae bacterium]|nr:hypothetical protein [Pyrinomonadaceae bacterium]